MRFFQVLAGAALISYTHFALANRITETELVLLPPSFEQQSLDKVLYESKEDLDKYLQYLSISQSIWLKHHWLRKLSALTHPTAEQQYWLENQLSSNESLTVANPDHPNKQLVVINIAQQAKASQQHWQINQQVELFQKQWGTVEWHWEDLVIPQNNVLKKAFSQWIRSAEQAMTEHVAEGYLIQIKDNLPQSNLILAVLAEHARSTELYALLWKNTADEFSYQALAKLPAMFDESIVIEQILQANNNTKLQSQALFLLAERYSHSAQAQQSLLAALDHTQARWYTAAVLNKITNQTFLAELEKKLSQQKSSSFKTLALKKIRLSPVYEAHQ